MYGTTTQRSEAVRIRGSNPNPNIALWEIIIGRKDPDPSIQWLKALGADVLIVSNDRRIREGQISRFIEEPYKFQGALPVLYDDHKGDVIYQVPRRYAESRSACAG